MTELSSRYESVATPIKLGYLFDEDNAVGQHARTLDADGINSHLVERFGQD